MPTDTCTTPARRRQSRRYTSDMSIDGFPTPEQIPSDILKELGFTWTGVTDTDEEPKTFDTVKRGSTGTAIAYDEKHREWALTDINVDVIEQTLIARGFRHGRSPLAPGPEDAIN